jgi:nucleoside diphosphate kinase
MANRARVPKQVQEHTTVVIRADRILEGMTNPSAADQDSIRKQLQIAIPGYCP